MVDDQVSGVHVFPLILNCPKETAFTLSDQCKCAIEHLPFRIHPLAKLAQLPGSLSLSLKVPFPSSLGQRKPASSNI
jgi:hypothetical protein